MVVRVLKYVREKPADTLSLTEFSVQQELFNIFSHYEEIL